MIINKYPHNSADDTGDRTFVKMLEKSNRIQVLYVYMDNGLKTINT